MMGSRFMAVLTLAIALSGCDSSPGPLAGTWKSPGIFPITMTFRSGETESLGTVQKVEYATDGDVVRVTYRDGIMKGSTMTFRIIDNDTIATSVHTLRRVQ